MSNASLRNEAVANQFWQTVETMKKLAQIKKLTRIVDCFEESDCVYCVQQVIGKQTLTTVMQSAYPQGADQSFAQKTIASVGAIVNSMHKRGVMHRRIDADVIGMRISGSKSTATPVYKVESLGGLDRVFALKP